MTDLSGTLVKGYALRALIAEGGFGAVYRADQMLIGRTVAVKVIRVQFANDPEFIRRFEAEAQIIAQLEHPYIVPLYDYWRDPSGAYLVMRWMRGGSLADVLRIGPLPLVTTAQVLDQIAAALALAHRRGVLHRDLKPANVLLDDEGHAYLADFGIAKDLGLARDTSSTAQRAFSPGYAAPEQILVAPVTMQTDIYSLGVLLYELLTGVRAFTGTTPSEIVRQQLDGPLPPLRERRPDLPVAIESVLQRATARDPAARYPDVRALTADAHRALAPLLAQDDPSADRAMPAADAQGRGASVYATVLLPAPTIENPYKGLRAFQEADASDFFGRETLTQRLLLRMAERGGPGVRS